MLKFALAAAAVFLAPAAALADPAPRYAEGQVWEYRTRPQDHGSLVRIQRIEHLQARGGALAVYHVSIIGVRFAGTDETQPLQHVPVSDATLDASVTRLSASKAEFPDPSEGIAVWRENHGGVFDAPLAEIVDVVEQALRNGTPQPD